MLIGNHICRVDWHNNGNLEWPWMASFASCTVSAVAELLVTLSNLFARWYSSLIVYTQSLSVHSIIQLFDAVSCHWVDIVYVSSIPLIVEVWQRDRQRSENSCLGVVTVPLSALLRSPRMKFVVSSAICISIQNCRKLFAVWSLKFMMCLCNCGIDERLWW